MTDPYKHSGGDTEGAVNPDTNTLRAKSDALLKRCGWWENSFGAWFPPGKENAVGHYRPHPSANAQDAIDLAEAMGLRVVEIKLNPIGPGYQAILWRKGEGFGFSATGHTIAEAICAAITEAVK